MAIPYIIVTITAIATLYSTSGVCIKHEDNTANEQRGGDHVVSLLTLRGTPEKHGNNCLHKTVEDNGRNLKSPVYSKHGHRRDETKVKVNKYYAKSPRRGSSPNDKPDSVQNPPSQSRDKDTDGDEEQCNPLDVTSLRYRDSIRGLEYLGSGYDVTKAKPFGEEETYVDTGYMQPVIKFTWGCHPKDPEEYLPNDVWVRREPACHRGHSVREVKNKSSLASMLAEDVTSSFGSDDIGVHYSSQHNAEKNNSELTKHGKYALKSQCAVFTAGMLLSTKWNLTTAFRNALQPLLTFTDKGKCQIADEWRENKHCRVYYRLWEELFNGYGTHVISRLTMGGKVLHITDTDTNKNDRVEYSEKDSRSNTNVSIFKANVDTKHKRETDLKNETKHKNSKYFIMGGDTFIDVNTENGWNRWVDSVEHSSMPIKVEIVPLSIFIPSEIRKSFWHAFNLYRNKNS